jgi:CHAT domain
LGNYANNKFGDAVHIFHFSGHASPNAQQWNDGFGDAVQIKADKLADYIGIHCKDIKLVFLNGCDSENQAQYFIAQGVRAVIATTKPVGDVLAAKFAVAFYEHFINLNALRSLRLAFEAAWKSLDWVKDETLKRDIDEELLGEVDLTKNLYELHIHPQYPDIENSTFDQWQIVLPRANHSVEIEPDRSKLQSKGIAESAFLLCDREQQQQVLAKLLDAKLQGKDQLPHFVAIHDEGRHCPQFLTLWLEHYGAANAIGAQQDNALKIGTPLFKKLRALSPDHFAGGNWSDPNNPEREKYKIELLDLFSTEFGLDAQQLLLPLPQARTPLLILTQLVDFEGWGESETSLSNFMLLMEYYRGAFSQTQLTGLSPRLLLILVFSYFNDKKDLRFEKMLKEQAQALPESHFTSITEFKYIRKIHLDSFQQNLDATFFDPEHILEKESPLSMFTAHKELKTYIQAHNKSIQRGG